jgi:hypothetical protein
MTGSRRTPRDVRSWLVVCSAIAALGCGPELAPPDANNPAPPGFPTDTAAYRDRLAQYPLSRNTHRQQRKSKCVTYPYFCSKIYVTIEALGNTLAIEPSNVPASAVPVAHLVNLDKKKIEGYYGLLPGDSAEYDLWVSQKPRSTQGEWRIVGQVKKTGKLIYGAATDLNYCHLGHSTNPPVSDADFAEYKHSCDYDIGRSSATPNRMSLSWTIIGSVVQHLFAFLTYSTSGGGWIDCARGCCT